MDHLPIPDHCKSKAVAVPYLGLAKYDGLGFEGFLERLDLHEDTLIDLLLNEKSRDRGESVLQEWLYFGTLHMLSEVWEAPLDLKEFIKDIDGQTLVTSEGLPDYLDDVLSQKRKRLEVELLTNHGAKFYPLNATEVQTYLAQCSYVKDLVPKAARYGFHVMSNEQDHHVELCLQTGRDILCKVAARFPKFFLDALRAPIVFSILILHESLAYAQSRLSGRPLSNGIVKPITPSPESFFESAMLENGWCPSLVENAPQSTSLAYFLSLLPSYDRRNHKECSKYRCAMTPKALSDITVQHDQSCPGNCNNISVPALELSRILDGGSFPVLERLEGDSGIEFEVVDAREKPDYVAISHVWAQGLGNPKDNSLPTCQVKRLFRAVKLLQPTEPQPSLWIDVLCVPLSGPSRKTAIAKLRDVYSTASKVLVLDKRLANIGFDNTIELKTLLLCSDWMSRLWTFQEGLLAKDFFVHFKGAILSFKGLLDHRLDDRSPISQPLEFSTGDELGKRFLRGRSPPTGKSETQLLDLIPSIQRRQTTVPEDEPICLATLLDLSFDRFNGMPSMKNIYMAMRSIPRSLVFFDGPRLHTPGFSWAPATFLGQPFQSVSRSGEAGTVTTQGLKISGSSIRLSNDFSLRMEDGGKAFILRVPSRAAEYRLSFRRSSVSPRLEPVLSGTTLLLEGDLSEAADHGSGEPIKAILVGHVESRPDGILQCKYGVTVLLASKKDPSFAEASSGPHETLTGDYVDVQDWCVD